MRFGRRFNPRARAGRDRHSGEDSYRHHGFQSTRPRGARPGEHVCCILVHRFQSTRPRGARPRESPTVKIWRCVSIHAPARGATRRHLYRRRGKRGFQSTRPRGARPRRRPPRQRGRAVSIHAPARGATQLVGHARTATPGFNPRARAGRDPLKEPIRDRAAIVSIHAPARGATRRFARDCGRTSCFNPRARAGRDNFNSGYIVLGPAFQSTRPRGARPRPNVTRWTPTWVSIHAPARGATMRQRRDSLKDYSFNPRARAGRDQVILLSSSSLDGFNPRARAGRDYQRDDSSTTDIKVSIHAPARGATGKHDLFTVIS